MKTVQLLFFGLAASFALGYAIHEALLGSPLFAFVLAAVSSASIYMFVRTCRTPARTAPTAPRLRVRPPDPEPDRPERPKPRENPEPPPLKDRDNLGPLA